MTEPFPMLASSANLAKIRYPVLGFPKIDGIRAVIHNQQALSRKLIELPNRYIQGYLSSAALQGLDGELVVGAPNDPLCIKHTTSGVMSREGQPDFTFYVFDKWDCPSVYDVRHRLAGDRVFRLGAGRIIHLPEAEIRCEDDLLEYEAAQLDLGYEGIILRDPQGAYKHGRSTAREGGMLKLKRFTDSEAEIVEVVEEQFNGNEAQKDNLGRTKRSSAKAGKTGKGRAGVLVGRDLERGWTVELGTGLSDADKSEWWAWWNTPRRRRRIAKYKFFGVGVQERPRHPVFISIRSEIDL